MDSFMGEDDWTGGARIRRRRSGGGRLTVEEKRSGGDGTSPAHDFAWHVGDNANDACADGGYREGVGAGH